MAQQIINNGTFDNDPSAEKIRTAFDKTNDNFTELYNSKLSNDISTYSPATTPLTGTELVLIEDGAGFKKVAVSEFGGGGGGTNPTIQQTKGYMVDFLGSQVSPLQGYTQTSGTADYNKTTISTFEVGHAGIVALKSTTTANSGYAFYTPAGGSLVNNGDNHTSFIRFKLDTITNTINYIGFHGSVTPSIAPTAGAWLEIISDLGYFKTKATATTSSASFTLEANVWYSLMIEFVSISEVYFKIKKDDGTIVFEFTSETNLPLYNAHTFQNIVVAGSSVATTAREILLLDSMEYRSQKPLHLLDF